MLPGLFLQMWTAACEYGWDSLLTNLEAFALEKLPSDLPDRLEEAFSTMSSRGRLRAAASLMAVLRGANSSLEDMCYLYSRLRSSASLKLEHFKLKGLCKECARKVQERAWKMQDALHIEFPAER